MMTNYKWRCLCDLTFITGPFVKEVEDEPGMVNMYTWEDCGTGCCFGGWDELLFSKHHSDTCESALHEKASWPEVFGFNYRSNMDARLSVLKDILNNCPPDILAEYEGIAND